MIQPTVGRIVWYHPEPGDVEYAVNQPLAAIISWVHDDRLINVGWFTRSGMAFNRVEVILVQDGDAIPNAAYCEWMPYQKGQAAKTEALEAKVQGSP